MNSPMPKKRIFPVIPRSSALVLLTLFVSLSIVAAYFISTDYHILTERAQSRSEGLATLSTQILEEKFERLTSIGIALATRVQFRKLIEAGDWNAAITIMDEVPKSFPYVDTIALFDPRGIIRAVTPTTPEIQEFIGSDFSYRDYYKGVSKNWQPYISEAFNRAADPKYGLVVAAIPIRSEANDAVIGIMLLSIKLENIVAWIKEIDIAPEKNIYLLDQNGHLAAHPTIPVSNEIRDYSSEPLVQAILQGNNESRIAVDPVGLRESLISYQHVPQFGWSVVVEEPVDTAFELRNTLLKKVTILWSVFITALGLITFLILRSRNVLQDRLAREQVLLEETARVVKLLEISNKDLESFTYSVSHDLRAPLRAIDGFSKILEEDYATKLNGDGAHIITTIRQGVARMGNLIDDLLAFSRLGRQAVQKADVDMKTMANSVFTELRKTNPGRNIQFSCKDIPRIHADPILMQLVWTNLLSNAVKFTRKVDVAKISIGSTMEDGFMTYFVKDNGVGFDMKYVHKLFKVFQRLHSAQEFEGSGIGLSIVSRIVEKHGGKVWATGSVGKGATFFFSLPTSFT